MTINTEKYITATKALASFKIGIEEMQKSSMPYDIARDAMIKRFALASDAFWKFIEEYLEDSEKIDLAAYGPNKIFLACADIGLVPEEIYYAMTLMIQDRLLVPIAYNEELAQEIADRIPEYFVVMKAVLVKIKV